MERDGWSSRRAFILAAVGSAIGLGNLIRFPYICAKFGGGAFLAAYLVAMVTAGFPIMLLEFGLGHKAKGAAPKALRRISPKLAWLGWAAVGVGFVIVVYYNVIMGWAFSYLLESPNIAQWAESAGTATNHFNNVTLGLTGNAFTFGGFQWRIAIGLLITWAAVVLSVWRGAKTVSKVVYATVAIPWIILLVFTVRALMLPGAADGLRFYLNPKWKELANPEVWLAAYTQAFFSLSIGFGVMIAYASFLPRRTDLTRSAVVICFLDTLTAFVGGLAVFGAAGFLAQHKGVPVKEVLNDMKGLGLAFKTYPIIIAKLPSPTLFCGLFFLMLLTLGIDSAFSLLEAAASAVRDKWNLSQTKANLAVAIPGFLLGLPLVAGCGLYWLDIVDHFMTFLGAALVCLAECLAVAVVFGVGRLRRYVNETSNSRLGVWWDIAVSFVAPAALVFLLVTEIGQRVNGSYEGYPRSAEFLGGWLILLLLPLAGIVLSLLRGKDEQEENGKSEEGDVFAEPVE